MKKYISILLIILSIIGKSQTADQIITKHLEVTGGINQWKSFNSVILKGEMVFGLNETYPIEIYQQRPNLNKTVMSIQGQKIILNGFNGKKAVQFNFTTNKLENVNNYIAETFESDLLDYSSKGFQAVLIGTEKVEGSDCFKIKLIKNTNTTMYYFDSKSYQLRREINQEETKTYSDFRKSSKLSFPHRIEVKSNDNQTDFVLSIFTIEVNKVISEKEFSF